MKIIRIDGLIGDWLNTGEDFQWRLSELGLDVGEELTIIINSPGGSVIDGFNIYNQIKALDNKTTIKIEGFAASIASLIAMSADVVQMSEVGQFMIHRASTSFQGDKNELEKQIDILESIDTTMTQVFSSKTGLTKKEIEKMLDIETWMSAAEAKRFGFIDEIVDKIDSKMAALYLLTQNLKNMNFKKMLAQLSGDSKVEETIEPEVEVAAENEVEVPAESEVGVTRAEFDELKAVLAALVEGLDQSKSSEKSESEVKAKADADELKIADIVADKFAQLIKALPGSKGQPTVSKTAFSETTKYGDKFAAFRAEQKTIEDKTRLQ